VTITDKQEPIDLDLDAPGVLVDDAEATEAAVHGAPDSAFERTAERRTAFSDDTPVNAFVCAHCGRELVLVKDNTVPPRNAHEAWKQGRCLSTHDRSLWSFCRADGGKLREPTAGSETSFDRRRMPG
jgi:hypothetical protein